MEEGRRRVPRFPFSGTAEVLEKGAPASIAARVTELSLFGCFVQIANPLAKGAQILLKIYTEGRYFEAQGSVLYSQPETGMGVGFHNVNPHYLMVLRQWLIESAHSKFGKKE